MLYEDILKLRKNLDESIRKGADYEDIYEISVELDRLITTYYEKKIQKEVKT